MNNYNRISFLLAFIVYSFFFENYLLSQNKERDNVYFNPSKKFTVYLYGDYVSSAVVQNDINSSDPIERAVYTDLSGGFGFGVELNFRPELFKLDLIYYVSTEYLKLKQNNVLYQYFDGNNIITYGANENYTLIPLEFGIKWPLPVGTDNLKIYIGGGAGIYFGTFSRSVGDLNSISAGHKPGYSLNVLAGIDYYIEKNIAANVELKFREASFDTDAKYNYITSIPSPFTTRLIAEGVRVSLGMKYNF